MKRELKGYMTVETTIALTTFMFMMMFFMNVAQIYQAQNYVTHGLLQSAKLVSFSSYEYKQNSAVATIASVVRMLALCEVGDDNELAAYWKTEQYDKAVKKAFGYCAGKDPSETNEMLKKYGLRNGIDGINFMEEHRDEEGNKRKYIIITAEYQIDLPFAFFGFDHVTMHQQIKCGLWS